MLLETLIRQVGQEVYSSVWAAFAGLRHRLKLIFLMVQDLKLSFVHGILITIEKHIPGSMIINIDQAPLKYVPTSNFTLAENGATSVTMEGGTRYTNISPNMTKYYQPFDLMVNGHAKCYLKNECQY